MYIKLFPETVPYINFTSTWTSHWNTDSSVKRSISGVTLSENTPWLHYIPVARHNFSFFSVIRIFEITYCIFALKCFSCSKGAYIKYVGWWGGGRAGWLYKFFKKRIRSTGDHRTKYFMAQQFFRGIFHSSSHKF